MCDRIIFRINVCHSPIIMADQEHCDRIPKGGVKQRKECGLVSIIVKKALHHRVLIIADLFKMALVGFTSYHKLWYD